MDSILLPDNNANKSQYASATKHLQCNSISGMKFIISNAFVLQCRRSALAKQWKRHSNDKHTCNRLTNIVYSSRKVNRPKKPFTIACYEMQNSIQMLNERKNTWNTKQFDCKLEKTPANSHLSFTPKLCNVCVCVCVRVSLYQMWNILNWIGRAQRQKPNFIILWCNE